MSVVVNKEECEYAFNKEIKTIEDDKNECINKKRKFYEMCEIDDDNYENSDYNIFIKKKEEKKKITEEKRKLEEEKNKKDGIPLKRLPIIPVGKPKKSAV